MKKILFVSVLIFLISSCVKYTQPPTLSLSGLYVIDKVVTEDNTQYNVGDTLTDINDLLFYTQDTVSYVIGDTLFEMDYSMIRTNPYPVLGGINWANEYYYVVHGQLSIYDYGYIYFDSNGTRRIWKILDDQTQSMTIRTEKNSDGKFLVVYLSRIGP
jgi:hypothetical protein